MGDDALRHAPEHKIDVAVLDHMMPGLTGLEVAQAHPIETRWVWICRRV